MRLVHLTVGSVLALGRRALDPLLVALGHGEADWTALYRLLNRVRIDVAACQAILVAQALAGAPPRGPVVAAVDAVQLPCISLHFQG